MPKYCPITGLELRISIGSKGFEDFSPSVDRKDPSKGYIKGNVGVISMRANRLKSNLSLEEIKRMYQYAILEGESIE